MKVCIVGASGKLGQYMIQHCLDKGYEVVGVCRSKSVDKLDKFRDRITLFPGATNDRNVIKEAVQGCQGVLTVLVPWGVQQYSSGTAQAVLDFAEKGARLIFSCGWHIRYLAFWVACFACWNWMTRLKHVSGYSKAKPGGQWFGEAILKRARVRDYRYGAGMLEIPS